MVIRLCSWSCARAMKLLQRRGFLCEIAINRSGCLAALCNCPDHERLPAAHISGGKDAIDRRHIFGCGHVAALVPSDTKLLDTPLADRAEKAHGQQDQVHIECELGA